MNRQNIVRSISTFFPTVWHNATKFGVNQILMAITLASISRISRINKIAAFNCDGLVKALLKLDKAINVKAIAVSTRNVKILESQNLPFTHAERDMNWKGKIV